MQKTLRILIIRFSSIGDIILTTPIIRCLKNQLNSDIDFLIKNQYSTLLHANPNINKIIPIGNNTKATLELLRSNKYDIVEPAHMELAEPSILTAYTKCVEKGAEFIVICPFFLGPGRHWQQDIPSLANQAAKEFPDTNYHVVTPLGVDELLLDLIEKRLVGCTENSFICPSCEGTERAGNL